MNCRQIDLHAIIKTLQNKILIQKQENKIIADKYENKIRQLNDEHIQQCAEKDRVIQYLKEELVKDREVILKEQNFFDSRRNKQKEQSYKQMDKYRNKCTQLEKKIQKITENYELRQKQLEEQLHKLQSKQEEELTSRSNLNAQIQKLNKFYASSKIQVPKRKETLEWVQKLNKFITNSQADTEKQTKQMYTFVKTSLQGLKNDLLIALKTAAEHEQETLKDRKSILKQIQQLVQDQNKLKKEMMDDNQKFWQVIRKERNGSQNDRIQQLQKQIAEEKKKMVDQNQQLLNRIKNHQSERKTLLLGFTELKTLYQSREKTYRDEIAGFKQTIQNLLTSGEEREKEFERQTKLLHGQLSSLNERYYENIQVPLHKMSNVLDNQIKNARLQLQKLNQNKNFSKVIQNLENVMQNYIVNNSTNTKISQNIGEYIKKTTQILSIAKSSVEIQEEKLTNQLPNETNTMILSKVNFMESNLKEVQWKQKQNKLIYEITTLKKQNKKLKQFCDSLQNQLYADGRSTSQIKRISAGSTRQFRNKNNLVSFQPTAKIIEMEGQIERLTRVNKGYEQQFFYQLNSLKESISILSGKQGRDKKIIINMYNAIHDIKYFNEQLADYLQNQNEHIAGIRNILATLNTLLIKPVQVFDNFVNKISGCCKSPHSDFLSIKSLHQSNQSQTTFQKLRSIYQDITVKRQQTSNSISRLVSELIRVLRQTTPIANRPQHKSHLANDQADRDKLQKSRLNKQATNMQKKIKQLQTNRIKGRDQMVRRLQKLEQFLKTIQSKSSKKLFIGVHKIEEILQKKIEQINEKWENKKGGANELGQITSGAIKQLKNKLKNSLTEIQGLQKQIQCIYLLKKE